MKRNQRLRLKKLERSAYIRANFPSKKPKMRGYDGTMFGPFRSSERMT